MMAGKVQITMTQVHRGLVTETSLCFPKPVCLKCVKRFVKLPSASLLLNCGGSYHRWENDRMEGKGVHVCAEGSRYEGQLRANYRDGHGRCQWGNRHDTPFRFDDIARVLSLFLPAKWAV